jgi:hypothetical protein
MSFTLAYDVTGAFYGTQPAGHQLCGYLTGSDGIAWTPAMWAAHPGAVRIDQDPDASVPSADVLDVERGAATPAEAAAWARQAMFDFTHAVRPGQRQPSVYCSASTVTTVVNALNAGGVGAGVGLWVANWSLSEAQAVTDVLTAAGPFPVTGVQFTDDGDYDTDVFSSAWLSNVSSAAPQAWCYSKVQDLALANYGPHSFEVTWNAPSGTIGNSPAGGPGVGFYEVVVCEGKTGLNGPEVESYPRYVPKGANPESFTGGSLAPGSSYTALVRARAADGTHSSPWAGVMFTTTGS